ncbi:hypothetical protein K0M31_000706 [Melipona bicolor]|uniref:Uncharacterized protein n=1 Tax=Melipona bicolor TaxID=60889 RepID=A0AA40GE89_9HYME|nr:hypothetical protein K0M31_000706 [Melipona bicolor]
MAQHRRGTAGSADPPERLDFFVIDSRITVVPGDSNGRLSSNRPFSKCLLPSPVSVDRAKRIPG